MGFLIGDRVRINIAAVERNGMDQNESQKVKYEYILAHPEEIYEILSTESDALAEIVLSHPLLRGTSFFEDELILVGGSDR